MIKPMTKKQLVEYFQVYQKAFSNWAVEHDVMLTREYGVLKQMIGFQALRSGAYRPSCTVAILLRIPDGCHILDQMLDVKHREVFPREHPTKWPLVIKAMEEQFVPSIRKPLDVAETLKLAEKQVEGHAESININYLTGLAALNAYTGNGQRALYWCDQIENRSLTLGRELADWEMRKLQFARDLRQAIEAGKEREFLAV